MHLFYKISVLIILILTFVNCTSKTQVDTNKTNKILGNGKRIEVTKTNKLTTKTGIITKINYGTTHSFFYTFKVDNGKIKWKEKGRAEPKHILFCKDSVYVHYLNKKNIPIKKEPTDTTNIIKYKTIVKEFYEVYIDKRYFFRLLGEEYWVEITPEQYSSKKTNCKEYEIPNENEYELISNDKELKLIKNKILK